MNINFAGKNFHISEELKSLAMRKFKKLTHHCHDMTSANIIFYVENENTNHVTEATIHVLGSEIFAKASTDDMYKSIDDLIDKLDRQLKKHKEKMTDHRRSNKQKLAIEEV